MAGSDPGHVHTHVLPDLISGDGHALLREDKALTAVAVAVVLIYGNKPASGAGPGRAGWLRNA